MTVAMLLEYLRLRGVKLWAEGGRLRYSAPAGVLTPDVRAQLVEHRGELLAMLPQAGDVAQPVPQLRPVPRDAPLPLSFAQQRLWSFDRLAPGEPVYNASVAVRLQGALDIAALQQGLDEVVRRHEAVRTNFVLVDRRPVQQIAPPFSLRLPLIDLGALPHAERRSAAQRLMTHAARRPFDLARDRLLRAMLLRLGQHEHLLLLMMHHIIADGWSMGVLIQESVTLYAAFAAGQPSPLPSLPVQYADYAVWQREWLQGAVLEEQLAYWKRQLADLPTLELPTDRPRLPVATFRGARHALSLSPELTAALKASSKQAGATLFMTLLAAFLVVLRYLSGQDDIVVGTDVADRNRAEVEGLIGFFANQLVLRTDLSGDPTFDALLGRLRGVVVQAFAHQDVPFEKLVALNPARDTSRTPLFQVKFVLQNAPLPLAQPRGLSLSPMEIDNGTTKFDVLVNMQDFGPGLTGLFEYNTDLFDGASIARMMRHFETLLNEIVARPDARLHALEELLGEADRQRKLIQIQELQSVRLQKFAGVRRRRAERESES